MSRYASSRYCSLVVRCTCRFLETLWLPLRSLRSKFLGPCFARKVFRDSVAKKSVPQRGSVWVAVNRLRPGVMLCGDPHATYI